MAGVEDGQPLVGGTMTTPPNAATQLLQGHMEELYTRRGALAAEIAELTERRARFEEEYQHAEQRYHDIAECKVVHEIEECEQQLALARQSEAAQKEALAEIESAVANYKDQLHKVFQQTGATSTEMQKHCKKKEDDEEHARTLEVALVTMQENITLAQETVAKKRMRHAAKAEYDRCVKIEKDLSQALADLSQRKINEEAEAAAIQASFENKKSDLEGLIAHLEDLIRQKAEVDHIIEQVEAPFKRIHESSATLLDVLSREKTVLKTQQT